MSDSPASSDRLQQAMKLLAEEVRERVDRHPLGHLVAGRGDRLDLRLAVPTALREGTLERAGRALGEAVEEAIQSLIRHSAIFQPGRVFCLRCASATCEHSAVQRSRHVFIGYGSTGIPRFVDLGQWLLQRRDPRVDLLYREPPQLLATVSSGRELSSELLPVFDQLEGGYRIHGQVAAGWYPSPVRSSAAPRDPVAVSFQVISSRARGSHRRFGLNVIGIGPEGEPLEHLYDQGKRAGEIPWSGPVRWAQSVLTGIEQQVERSPRMPGQVIDGRIDGLVASLARRLEKGWRGKERRTQHAEVRHREGDRPTRMALADLARATPENLLFDPRSDTLVVVGDRGRAHVFSREGKLVTSIRYTPAAIEKRRQNGMWRQAAREEVEGLRQRLEKEALEKEA